MRVLLDTHAFLWAGLDAAKLSPTARAIVADTANEPVLSVASLWEIAIKLGKRRLTLGRTFEELVSTVIAEAGISILPIEIAHLNMVVTLPPHHRDPFDRLLVAQALAEGLRC